MEFLWLIDKPTITVTMLEEEVVDSNVDLLIDELDDVRGKLFCCDWIGNMVVVVNVDLVDFRVESGNWKLDEVNARIMIVLIMILSIRIIMLTPFTVESHNCCYAMKD